MSEVQNTAQGLATRKPTLNNELAKDTANQLTAWKKRHPLDAYYGPPPETYQTSNISIKTSLPGIKETHEKQENTPETFTEAASIHSKQEGYTVPNYRPPPDVPPSQIIGPTKDSVEHHGQRSHPGPTLSAVKEGKVPAVMDPHLQVLCGPMLRYDTVRNGMWYGAVLLVTNDAESVYAPAPALTVEWDAEGALPFNSDETRRDNNESDHGEQGEQDTADQNALASHMQTLSTETDATSPTLSQPRSSGEYSRSSSNSDEEPTSSTDSKKSKSGTWASSMRKKLAAFEPNKIIDDFKGHPPEHISKAEPEREKQKWATKRLIEGEPIYKYTGIATTATFWRFMLEIPVNPDPERGLQVHYAINKPDHRTAAALDAEKDGETMGLTDITFHIPPTGSDMRFAAFSCNGFSQGVDQTTFTGGEFKSGYDPVWADLLQKHEERPFHALVGGGDQIYCDAITKEAELEEYMSLKTRDEKIYYPLTNAISFAVDRFYFSHYCMIFRSGCFARAISQIPMVNMLDDHDLIDGFGSYPDPLQRSPIFNHIGTRGYFWYLLFQLFTVDAVDGTSVELGQHPYKSMIIGANGPYIPFPSHSSLHWFGAHTWMLMLDCRAERRHEVVLSPDSYQRILDILHQLPSGVEHLIVQLGIPIAYPRMNLTEKLISSDGLIAKAAKSGLLPGMANKFNKDIELLDDLSDHWTARHHKRERNWFILQLQEVALKQHVRITFISGDVHLAAVGLFKTYPAKPKRKKVDPAMDHRWMLNIISSAIVNTPPPAGLQVMVNSLATHKHRTLHLHHTDEVMLPLFQEGLRTDKRRLNYVAGARNYTTAERDPTTGEFVFSIRVERRQGEGETKGYVIRAPAPNWKSENSATHS